jgi:sigma-B regulation protein RsbU (phosphoserine phosphatase)
LPVEGCPGHWLEVILADVEASHEAAARLLPVVSSAVSAEREAQQATEELANRLEEIDLLYTISEILGQTLRLEEAAQTIVHAVSDVVGAARASILVADDEHRVLRPVAMRGFARTELQPIALDDPAAISAQVYREGRIVSYDPAEPTKGNFGCGEDRGYKGEAFLSVPIIYAAPGGNSRCVGVINLTDRVLGGSFSENDRKLVAAIANQIGAAIENARLVARDLHQQRLRRELELAHDLQLKLLPAPSVLQGVAEVAARCRPADSVGGDFYTFWRLGQGRVGVMLGDVSSHGFSAALVMALVLAAAGIHAESSVTPDETLEALLESLGTELATTEMFLSIFYGVLDRPGKRLVYANAGHQHAYRIPVDGAPERLDATAPPLGLAAQGNIQRREIPWRAHDDLLCLWTDGLVDACNGDGEPFGETRLLAALTAHRSQPAERIVEAVIAEADAFAPKPTDDRTLLVIRL